jgi:hypothetical protein
VIDAGLITDLESCERRGYYSRDYLPRKLHPTELTRQAIYEALTIDTDTPGAYAGAKGMELCASPGIETPYGEIVYDIGIHHCAIADIVTTWARFELGSVLEQLQPVKVGDHTWAPSSLYSEKSDALVRIVLVDHFSEDRILGESRSWYTLGDIAVYNLPMIIWLVSLGASRAGKRHSAWAKGLMHPKNGKLRFKPRQNVSQGFKETWVKIWREDYASISQLTWLNAMAEDGVINDLTKEIRVDVLEEEKREEIQKLIGRKASEIQHFKTLPDPKFSACDYPRPCPFRSVCFAPVRATPDDLGFRSRHDI